jgi:hypothetical protein
VIEFTYFNQFAYCAGLDEKLHYYIMTSALPFSHRNHSCRFSERIILELGNRKEPQSFLEVHMPQVKTFTLLVISLALAGSAFAAPFIATEPEAVDFGDVYIGDSPSVDVTVTNTGDADLTIDQIGTDNNVFVAPRMNQDVVLASEESHVFAVQFAPQEPQAYNSNFIIHSDAVNGDGDGNFMVPLSGNGLFSAPVIRLVNDPDPMDFELFTGGTDEGLITVSNDGIRSLNWIADIELIENDRDAAGRELRRVDEAPQWTAPTGPIPNSHDMVTPVETDKLNREMRAARPAAGPRRDQPESAFAFFWDTPVNEWGGGMEAIWDQVEANVTDYGSGDFEDAPLGDYDVIWIREYQSDQFNRAWNDNRARFEEWVDGGGVLYHATATNNWNVDPINVGGITRLERGSNDGEVAVSNDPNADNYNYLAELQGWEEGDVLNGSSFAHSSYTADMFEGIDNSDYYQVIAHAQGNPDMLEVVVYNYGRGWSVVSGTTDTHQYNYWNDEGQWGESLDDLIWYLDFLANLQQWLAVSPEEGALDGGESQDVLLDVNAFGLAEPVYEANIHFLSNDPTNPDLVVPVSLNVSIAADINITWDEELGYPDVLNWNLANADLFNNHPYPIVVKVKNEGSVDLNIQSLAFDDPDGVFSADPAENFAAIAAGASMNLTLTLNSAASGLHQAAVTLTSDDPYNGEYSIRLRGETASPPTIDVAPQEITDALYTGGYAEHTLEVTNIGESVLRWNAEIENIENERDAARARIPRRVDEPPQWTAPTGPIPNSRDMVTPIATEEPRHEMRATRPAAGPRRDQPESRYAFFQDRNPWGYDMERVFRDADVVYDRYGSGDFGDVDLSEYDCVWVVNNEQGDNYWSAWNDNIGWVEEWIDGGGAFYEGGGRNVGRTHPLYPGGLHDCERNAYSSWGDAAVGPDDNFLWEYMGWDENTEFFGNYFCHQYFPADNLENIDNSHWYQVMATSREQNDEAAIMVYGYGRGFCIVTTTTDGFSHAQPGDHLWGTSGEGVLWYLDFLANTQQWVSVTPEEGALGAGESQDVFLILNAFRLAEDVYEANIHFLSNDPNTPDFVVPVSLNVTGAADINATWDEELGYPDVLDWNRNPSYLDLYTGGSYDLIVNVANEGTEALEVNDVSCENGFFTANPNQFDLAVETNIDVTITFNADIDEPGDYFADMVFATNDPDEQEYLIHMHAHGYLPPVGSVTPTEIIDELYTGEKAEHHLTVANTGDAPFRFATQIELPEGGRDAVGRELRRVDGSAGPKRDEGGEVLEEYEIPYPSTTGLAWDPDNELIWGYCNDPQGTIFAFNPDQGEVVAEYNGIEAHHQTLTYWEGLLYVQGNNRAANTIFVYDLEGNQVDQINTPFRLEFRHSTISEWNDQALFFIRGARTPNGRVGEGSDAVYVYTWPDFEAVAHIQDADETGDNSTCGVLWVPKDTDGQLWVDGMDQLYELKVEDDWSCQLVQQFDVERTVERAGMTHDKFD